MDFTLSCGANHYMDSALRKFVSPKLASASSPLLPRPQEMNCHIFAFQNLNGHPNLKKKKSTIHMNIKQISFEVTERDSLCIHQINEALVLFTISFH